MTMPPARINPQKNLITALSQLTLNLTIPPTVNFDQFVVGRNREAVETLQKNKEDFIALWGKKGAGKTHLLKAWVYQAQLQGKVALYVDLSQTRLLDLSKDVKYLSVDHAENADEPSQMTLFSLYNRFRSEQKKLLVASNNPPSLLALREDLRTRIAASLVFEIHPLSDQEKLLAIQHYAHTKQIKITQSVLQYLLQHYRRDLQTLTAIIDILDQEALKHQRQLTLPFLKSILLNAQD